MSGTIPGMRWLAICALVLVGCGSVGSSTNDDGGGGMSNDSASGTTCPVEDYMITGGSGNPACQSQDLYSMSSIGETNVTCTTQGTCSQLTICASAHIVAHGTVTSDGLCAYSGSRVFVDEAADCTETCTFTGVADYQRLQANAGAPTQ